MSSMSNVNVNLNANQSDVWLHFEKLYNEATNKPDRVRCLYCAKILKFSVTNGTSSMHKHLSSCKKYPSNIDKSQSLISSFKTNNKEGGGENNMLTTWRFNLELCRKLFVEMIIIMEEPFRIAEHPALRRFLNAMQPLWKDVSRNTIARDVEKIYDSEKVSLKSKLCSLKSRISLTTDIWTSIQNTSYLCLTGHYIDENWVLHKRILNLVPIGSHKGREIGRAVEKCILGWGIENKIGTITVDNASANDVAITYLKSRLPLILNGEFFHMRCTAHVLNLIVKDGLSETKDSISRIRNSVKYVRSSPARSEAFQRCVKEERITCKGSVCLDVATRWNSTYMMLDVAIKFKKAFKRLEDDDPNYLVDLSHDTPSDEDWEKAIIFAKFLKKFYESTKKVSGSNYVTSNTYFQETVGIVLSLNEWEKDTNPGLYNMSKKMREKFDKYYGSIDKSNMMVLVAAILDPRFKMKYVGWGYKRIFGNNLEKVELMTTTLTDFLQRLYEFYVQVASTLEECQSSTSSQLMGVDHSSAVGVDCDNTEYDPSMDGYAEEMEVHVQDIIKSELEIYLEEKCLPVKSHLNILDWWKVNAEKYKVLSLVARDVFAIPVSTVASESAFSTSGRVLDKFRSSLSTSTVEAVVCTQDWLRFAYTPTTFEDYLIDAEGYDAEIISRDQVIQPNSSMD